ncbi:MAG: hypothetical protein JWO43_597 [Candidatus Adlerbacteria bacterium]|nr:hypothetical protein [Candidatus Adlerbacteria bacterium]
MQKNSVGPDPSLQQPNRKFSVEQIKKCQEFWAKLVEVIHDRHGIYKTSHTAAPPDLAIFYASDPFIAPKD